MSYQSGFCENGISHEICREHYPAYGQTPAQTCTCRCHRLAKLIQAVGHLEAVDALEAVLARASGGSEVETP